MVPIEVFSPENGIESRSRGARPATPTPGEWRGSRWDSRDLAALTEKRIVGMVCVMKALKTTLATLLLVVAVDAADHDERRVPLDEATIKSNKYGAEATLAIKEDGSLRLTILLNGKTIVIPERALAVIKDADLASAAFSTETPTGLPVSEWKLKGGIILSFYYGDKVTQGFGKVRREGTLSACRIKISADGNYERIETAVPQGNDKFGWRILVQSKDGKDMRRETVESEYCPIPMRWN